MSTTTTITNFIILSGLVAYPERDYKQQIHQALMALKTVVPASLPLLEQFSESVQPIPITELEEYYSQTFDFDPNCALDLGWHLYGENYGRGDFLVKMRDLLSRTEVQESQELPDHLTHVLLAYSGLDDIQGKAFSKDYILPALKKLIQGLQKKETPYRALIDFITSALAEYYAIDLESIRTPDSTESASEQTDQESDFNEPA